MVDFYMRKYLFFVLTILFIFSQTLFAEEFSENEINIVRDTKIMYTKSVYSLINEAKKYSLAGEYNTALDVARHAYIASNNMKEKVTALLAIAGIYEDMKDYNRAKLVYRKIIRNFPSMEKETRIAKNRLLSI